MNASVATAPQSVPAQTTTNDIRVDFRTNPSLYQHWNLSVDGDVATLAMDVNEDKGLVPGYKLKLNSYDLGVDIELHDALQRIRFEHPQVKSVVVTSLKERIFCSGANIFMLGQSSHAWKVNFCKFTNETRNGIEDSSKFSNLKFIAALNGICAGGGYELALACDEIYLVDDRSSAVSLPEVPLLGVLPGTGGLTRLTDKRKVRHDHADVFCTLFEGVRGQRAKDWRLVDDVIKTAQFNEFIENRAAELAAEGDRPQQAEGVTFSKLEREETANSLIYKNVEVHIDRENRTATWTIKAPTEATPTDIDSIVVQGENWWPLQFVREFDDAILMMRTNENAIGTWLFKTEGNPDLVLASDQTLMALKDHWLVRETLGFMRRTFARLDVSSRSMYALVEENSCFVGSFYEIAAACDRIYMLDDAEELENNPYLVLNEMNFGVLPLVTHQSRLGRRFYEETEPLTALKQLMGQKVQGEQAEEIGLATYAFDDLNWEDEIRIAVEERISFSPDALTGLEANLRFSGVETMETRIFGRLSAWQNWIFVRPNAAGEKGALTLYGKGESPSFDWNRV